MRPAQSVTDIWVKLLPRFEGSSATLQGRIKEMMVRSILDGLVPSDAAMPPSRSLAQALGVSRNTVSLALQQLVDKGFLVSRERSGLFVNPNIVLGQAGRNEPDENSGIDLGWRARLKTAVSQQRNIAKPARWQDFAYPFVYGQFDATLMPLVDWRACSRQSLLVPAVRQWSQDHVDRDHPGLVSQIQHRLLPARGIVAQRDQILVTAGAQMACYLLAQVLMDSETVVGMEDPGYPDARNNFALRSGRVLPLAIDEQGLLPSRKLGQCDYVYVTPSHQCPTSVTMPLARRQALLDMARKKNVVLFEDDHESELNFSGRPLPALKSLDSDGRVIYLGSLSKTLAHGLRLGYIVAAPELIRELRALRRLLMRHVPSNNAHIASLFIAQGYHDAFIRKLNVTYRERRGVLLEALARWLPDCTVSLAHGGSGAWVQGPEGLDATVLAQVAQARGVLIEPGSVFFARPTAAQNRCFRMGYSAIPSAAIEAGVRELQQAYVACMRC
ncbi:PLP-dependent aminotransferase family protein [Pseudogulbenkiania sp. MAI-1]|uniref:MocR-like pyridoxine biosynthesis transcription factor PdxR n=1 Tax=Pseudogulbenkiania sp. MAI-1 TaxID=990370 RepID=UPI0004A37DEE|nr:PLP-dependent aminotransferase family protein [Pseudogulbenkiania sp. MAI-1]